VKCTCAVGAGRCRHALRITGLHVLQASEEKS
jgi:hypothetical protein